MNEKNKASIKQREKQVINGTSYICAKICLNSAASLSHKFTPQSLKTVSFSLSVFLFFLWHLELEKKTADFLDL